MKVRGGCANTLRHHPIPSYKVGKGLGSALCHRIAAASNRLDESLLGAALGALILLGFMVAIPVLLPLIFGGDQW